MKLPMKCFMVPPCSPWFLLRELADCRPVRPMHVTCHELESANKSIWNIIGIYNTQIE